MIILVKGLNQFTSMQEVILSANEYASCNHILANESLLQTKLKRIQQKFL